jgi:capsular polysaccharide biosynthesis protein
MLRVLRRRGWVLLVAIAVTTSCAYFIASARGETFTAESTAVVVASPNSLLTPDEADALAGTYAAFIPKDAAIDGAVANALGTSVPDVEKRLSAFNTTGTGLLSIDYQGTSAADSIAGATAALKAIAGRHPVSTNIIPGSVGAVQVPTRASASRSVAVLVAIGVILGIALGALLMVIWERVDPRIDRPEDLSQETGSPTSPVSAISQSGVNALVARWTMLADRGPSRIALVPVTSDVQAVLPKVALILSQVQRNDRQFQENGASHGGTVAFKEIAEGEDRLRPTANGVPTMIVCAVPAVDLTALESIMDCDLVVLVARKGTPRATLRESLDSLTEFGVSPKWAIFLGTRTQGLLGRKAT